MSKFCLDVSSPLCYNNNKTNVTCDIHITCDMCISHITCDVYITYHIGFAVMSMYSYCMFMYLHRACCHVQVFLRMNTWMFETCRRQLNWIQTSRQSPSSATPDWGFSVLFPQLWGKCQGITRKDGARPALFQTFFVLFYVLFVLCRSVHSLCVNVYCTTATGWLPDCS